MSACVLAACAACCGALSAPQANPVTLPPQAVTNTAARAHADATALPPEHRGKLAVFLLAGQSNMVGFGPLKDSTSKPHPRVFLLGNDYQWKQATEPIDSPANQVDTVSLDPNAQVGPPMAFARALVEDPDLVVGLVPCAKGGRPLYQFRKQPGRDTLYGSMLHRANEARKMGTLAGVLFFQGEGDANDAQKRPETYGGKWDEKFVEWVRDVRADLGDPNLPVVFAQLGTTASPQYVRWQEVKNAQARVKLPRVAMIKTDDLPRRDNTHFTTPSYEEIGRRFARAYRELTARQDSGSKKE